MMLIHSFFISSLSAFVNSLFLHITMAENKILTFSISQETFIHATAIKHSDKLLHGEALVFVGTKKCV